MKQELQSVVRHPPRLRDSYSISHSRAQWCTSCCWECAAVHLGPPSCLRWPSSASPSSAGRMHSPRRTERYSSAETWSVYQPAAFP